MACLIVFAHYPKLRERVDNCRTLAVNFVKQYKYYKLRITVSAVFAILCVGLTCLWVRSHVWRSTLQGVIGSQRLQFTSENGSLAVLVFPNVQSRNFPRRDWTITSSNAGDNAFRSWRVSMQPNDVIAVLPWWFVVLVLVIAAATPWIRWKYSLRTLLIATTLVAVALGLAVAMR
jgi:hypothetical protein